MFSFCSQMLIYDPKAWAYLKYGNWRNTETTEWMALTDFDYGAPYEDYQVEGSHFSRRFENATIHVEYSDRTAWISEAEPPPPAPTLSPILIAGMVLIGALTRKK